MEKEELIFLGAILLRSTKINDLDYCIKIAEDLYKKVHKDDPKPDDDPKPGTDESDFDGSDFGGSDPEGDSGGGGFNPGGGIDDVIIDPKPLDPQGDHPSIHP